MSFTPVEVILKNQSDNPFPKYETSGSSGMDIYANESVTLPPHSHRPVSTGLYVKIPHMYEIQIRPRSGLAFKHGVTVLNAPGTIDSDYRGEIKVILVNHSQVDYTVNVGDRIAQMVLAAVEYIIWKPVIDFVDYDTERAAGGFGSTGK